MYYCLNKNLFLLGSCLELLLNNNIFFAFSKTRDFQLVKKIEKNYN